MGKTVFSQKLKEALESKEEPSPVVVVSEESENVQREHGYADAGSEKVTRC